jgi:hypothetical protein
MYIITDPEPLSADALALLSTAVLVSGSMAVLVSIVVDRTVESIAWVVAFSILSSKRSNGKNKCTHPEGGCGIG